MYDIIFSWAAALPEATRKPIVQVSNELIASLQSTCLFMICFFVFFRETTATTRLLASSTRRNMTIGDRPGGAGLRQACDPCRQGLGRQPLRQPVHSLSAFLPFFGSLHEGWRLSARSGGPGARVPSEPCGEDGRRLCHGAPDRERRASHFEKPSQPNSMSTNGGLAEPGVQNGGSS